MVTLVAGANLEGVAANQVSNLFDKGLGERYSAEDDENMNLHVT